MSTELILSENQVKAEILKIRKQFGFTAKKMCERMNMNHQTFRNNCANGSTYNNFKHSHLFRLKNELFKIINIYNHDNNQNTTYLRR